MSTTGGRLKHVGAGEVWSVSDASELYEVPRWGKGYFGVNDAGHVTVHPNKDPDRAIDLKDLVDELQARGINLPLLLRFTDILRHRIGEIDDAFKAASPSTSTAARYSCVYPIKVNQQRHVVEEVLDFGKPYGFGLEAGSKPELLAVAGDDQRRRRPSSATGSRTTSSSRWWCWPARSGKNIIPVVEKFTELELIVKYTEELGVRQPIGVRVKLAARGGGRWQGVRRLPVEVRADRYRGAARRSST